MSGPADNGRSADTSRLRYWLDLEVSKAWAAFESGKREVTQKMQAQRTMRDGIRLKEEIWLAESILRPLAEVTWDKVRQWGGGTVAAPGIAENRLLRLLDRITESIESTALVMNAGQAAKAAVSQKLEPLLLEIKSAAQLALITPQESTAALGASRRPGGRRRGTGGFRSQDEIIARAIRERVDHGDTRSPWAIAQEFEDKIPGSRHGDNHLKRVTGLYHELFSS
jgi:hypothetical protein